MVIQHVQGPATAALYVKSDKDKAPDRVMALKLNKDKAPDHEVAPKLNKDKAPAPSACASRAKPRSRRTSMSNLPFPKTWIRQKLI